MRPRWRKVLADLWDNKLRTLLVVASIAVGVFAVGMIAGTYSIISTDLHDSYVAANPANIRIVTDSFDREFAQGAARLPGVAQAEGRALTSLRLHLASGEWDVIELASIPDLAEIEIMTLIPLSGSMDPGDQEVVLERKTIRALGLELGDTIQVEMTDGTERSLLIVGAAQDVTDGYGVILGNYYGYVSPETFEWLGMSTTLNRLYLTVSEQPNDKAHLRSVAEEAADWLEKSGRTVYSTTISQRDKSELSSIIEALLGVLGMLGLLAVLLSGSLIANTMSALLGQHVRQIGVMKLVGARRSQIVTMYMMLMVALGAISLVVAAPAALWAANSLAALVSEIVNFPLSGFRVVPLALVLMVIISLGAPPVAGLWPVLGGSRVTVRQAISSTGISGGKASGGVDRRLGGLRNTSRLVLVSLRNTFRSKGRLALTLVTLTLGGAVFISVFNTRVALNSQVDDVTEYFLADVNLTMARPYRVEEIKQIAGEVPGVELVEAWAATAADMSRDDGTPPEHVALMGPPSDTSLLNPTMLAGRWLVDSDDNALVINEAFWTDHPDLAPGDRLRLDISGREEDWVIVGVFQYTGVDQLIAYANYRYLAGELGSPHDASSYRLVTTGHDLASQREVGEAVQQHLMDLGFRVQEIEAGQAFATSITRMLGILTLVLLAMALLTALVGSIGLAGTMSMNVLDRTREIGVLRAIGAHDGVVVRLVMIEGMLIGAISSVLGIALSFPITTVLSNLVSKTIFNAPAGFAFSAQGVAIWLALVVLLSAGASLVPARRASRLTIREVLAYD